MTLILKQLFAFLKLLNSDTGTNSLATGIVMGFILGMSPAVSLQTFLVLAMLFLFRIQIGAALVSAFFFAFIAWLLDPVFHEVGSIILESSAMKGIFTTMYNLPLVPFTKFYNSIVMGSGIVAILLAPIIFILSKLLIQKYRSTILERIKQTKFFKALKATAFYKWYYKYDQLY